MKKYKYVGDGAGVPGLPHEITDEQAAADDTSEILRAAIENGSYVAVETTPTPDKGKGRKKLESEVNDG